MLGEPDSCGVWAPCLNLCRRAVLADLHGRETLRSHHGRRHVRRIVARFSQLSGDVAKQSTAIGPIRCISIPAASIRRCSTMMMDENILLNMLWDHRPGNNRFAGIVLQEYSPHARSLIGKRKLIFPGTSLGLTEAPHLYKRNGYYYLLTAEGGTGWNHAVTMARSRNSRRPVRTPSRYLYFKFAQPAGCRIAARRPRRSRRNAEWRNLYGPSLRPPAGQSRPLHTGPRNGDPEDGLGSGWLAANA